MPIDASIITGLKTPPPDPLGRLGKVQDIQQGMLNNRLLSQTVAGKEALGRIIGLHTGPDGETDWNGVSAEASKDPRAAILLPEIQKAALERQRTSVGLDTDKLNKWRAEVGLNEDEGKQISHSLLPAVQAGMQPGPDGNPAGLTREQAIGAVIDAARIANISARPQAAQRFKDFIAHLTDDPMANLKAFQNITVALDPSQERVDQIFGKPGSVSTGAGTQGTRQDITGAIKPTGTPIPNELSPSQLAAIVTYDDDQGVKHTTTLGDFLAKGGKPGEATPAPAAGGRTGRYPGATGHDVAGPKPGVVSAQTTSANQSATTFQEDVKTAGGYSQRLQGLEKGYEALQKSLTGPGTKGANQWLAVLDSYGIHPSGKDKVESYAEAQKYLQDYANQRGANLGFGTDAARGLVNAANPGVQTPKATALQVLNVIKGLERMQASQVAAAQAEGVTPDKYAEWRAKWNRSVDPAAFAPPKLDKAGWEAKRKAMGEKWGAYQRGLNAALAAGVLTAADLRK